MPRTSLAAVLCLAAVSAVPATLGAQIAANPPTLIENVRVFDGRAAKLSAPTSVLIEGNRIARIAPSIPAPPDAAVIAGGGRTLMPGLIDAHWHTMFAATTPMEGMGDPSFTALVAAREARDTLLRGFTTVRDLGGPAFGLKRAIDTGLTDGPRIHPSGAMITVTSGHGDFRQLNELPRTIGGLLSRMEVLGGTMVADSPDEVRVRVREQLMQGASQIKLTAGGGVASPFSPIDVSTFTEAELRAAVEAADNWGTYVAVHAYTPAAIQRSIAAGVKVIEHGHLMDEASARLMAEKGIWLSIQPFLGGGAEIAAGLGPDNLARKQKVVTGTDTAYALAKKYKLKTAFGTDLLFSAAGAKQQTAMLAQLVRWYSPAELLKMATADNAELLLLSGERNPYPGKFGTVEPGAYADLLVVDGDPLANIALIEDPAKNFVLIMKDGKIYKNTIEPAEGRAVGEVR